MVQMSFNTSIVTKADMTVSAGDTILTDCRTVPIKCRPSNAVPQDQLSVLQKFKILTPLPRGLTYIKLS